MSSVQLSRTGREIRSDKVAAKRRKLRAALVDESAHLFAQRGVARVSVEDVLRQVGTSRASFYDFFASKGELIAASILPVFAAAALDLERLATSDPAASVDGIIDMYLDLWAEYSEALLLINEVDQSVFPFIEDEHRQFMQGLRRVLIRAEQAGVLRNDSAELSHAVLARTGVALLRIYKDHPDLEQLYRDSVTSLLRKPHDQGELA